MIDYIEKLEQLFNEPSTASPDQSEEDKLCVLRAHFPLK